MAGAVSFQLDSAEVQRALSELGSRAHRGIPTSLNRAARSVRTFMKREVAKELGAKVGDVNKQMSIRRATPGRPRVTIGINNKRIPLIKLGARGPRPSRGRGRGVTYKTRGGRRTIRDAFIAKIPGSDREGVHRRVRRARTPTFELFGGSYGQAFKKHISKARVVAQREIVKNLRGLILKARGR